MITYNADKHAAWIKARYAAIDKAETKADDDARAKAWAFALAQTRPGQVASVPSSIVPDSMEDWMKSNPTREEILEQLSELEGIFGKPKP